MSADLEDALAATRAQLTAAWDVRGIDMATIHADAGTVSATRRRIVTSVEVARTLPPLLDDSAGGSAPFQLGRTLGQGGMGLVRAAQQLALGREVAIKTLHPDADPRNAAQLLREALVTGALEHPNIVPVHALGRDPEGRPLIVMKRVDGVGWDSLLASEAASHEREAFLRKHLAVLLQVARATHFAHGKGIIHRDIKPSNVMLGAHDDVYLVDWGIAVSLREDGIAGVPRVRDSTALEGTPAYMAPEMAASASEAIDERTDVYLLGATLHEVLTGEAPHDGAKLVDVLTVAYASSPKSYPAWVPDELAEVCRRAMSRAAEERHQSALAFARAIEEVLEHRASVILAEQAARRLPELDAVAIGAATLDPAELQSLYMTFSECRFGLVHALSSWPDNARARDDLQRAVSAMVKVELAREAPDAAELLLHDLPYLDEQLSRRVAGAVRKQRKQGAELERMVYEADLGVGARQRSRLAFALGVMWLLAICGVAQADRRGLFKVSHVHLLVFYGFCIATAAGAIASVRRSLQNRASRIQMLGLLLSYFAYVVTVAVCWARGLDMPTTTIMTLLVGGVAYTCAAFFFDRHMAAMPVTLAVGLPVALIWPDLHFEVFAGCGAVGAAGVAWLMSRPQADATAPSQALSSRR